MTRRARSVVLLALAAGLAVGPAAAGLAQPVTAQPVAARANDAPSPAAVARAATGTAVPGRAVPSRLKWTRCGHLQCSALRVPLDHSNPRAGTTTISLARRPADDPAARVGVLFVNPGGPGLPAADSVLLFAQTAGRTMRQSFDFVGIDPRGTGGSDFALCKGKPGQVLPEPPIELYPTTPAGADRQLAYDAALRGMCRTSAPRIMRHMSTADVARDMDLVRAALGQRQVNYWGVSYGSMIGATYAALFPSRVRAVVVEGVIDPVAWSTGRAGQDGLPATTRIGSHRGTHEALFAAFAECERSGANRCPEHRTIRADWAALPALLRRQPRGPADMPLGADLLNGIVATTLYDGEGVPDLMRFLRALRLNLEQQAAGVPKAERNGVALRRSYDRLLERDRENRQTRIAYDPPLDPQEPEPAPLWFAGFEGVMCSETRNPTDPRAWVKAAADADKAAPGFGSLWTWRTSVCAQWPLPAKNAYRGSYDVAPARGLLVMNSRHDPATPYSGAQALRRISPGSRLVTLEGWGHGVNDASGCASWLRTKYLMTGTLPAKDVTCRPDHPLFTPLD